MRKTERFDRCGRLTPLHLVERLCQSRFGFAQDAPLNQMDQATSYSGRGERLYRLSDIGSVKAPHNQMDMIKLHYLNRSRAKQNFMVAGIGQP